MHYFWLSVLFVLAAGVSSAATPFAPNSSWSDMHTKHRWNAVPEKWERVGHPSVDTMIDLRIALKPHRENALIDALYEVSNPKHPKHVLYSIHLPTHMILTCDTATLQIRRIPL